MSTVELRKELHHLIDKADDDLLEVIHSIMTPKSIQGFQLSQTQMELLDQRLDTLKENEGSDWEEVKSRIQSKL